MSLFQRLSWRVNKSGSHWVSDLTFIKQVEDNAAKQKLINSEKYSQAVGDDVSNNIGYEGDESAEIDTVEGTETANKTSEKGRQVVGDDISNNIGDEGDESAGTETAKKTSDPSMVKGSGSGLRSGSSTFTEARDKQVWSLNHF